jgi:hypothetical protein
VRATQTSVALESSVTPRRLALTARVSSESGVVPGMAKPNNNAIWAVRANPDHARGGVLRQAFVSDLALALQPGWQPNA